jgi:hypothetical protein
MFYFRAEEIAAMGIIKDLVIHSLALRLLNYSTHNWPMILTIDFSIIAIRYILIQVCDDKHWYPSRFGSITKIEHDSRYSQVKLELYGLFHALHAYHIYIIKVKIFIVEVDAKYLK